MSTVQESVFDGAVLTSLNHQDEHFSDSEYIFLPSDDELEVDDKTSQFFVFDEASQDLQVEVNSQVSSPTTVSDCIESVNPISIVVPKVEFSREHNEESNSSTKTIIFDHEDYENYSTIYDANNKSRNVKSELGPPIINESHISTVTVNGQVIITKEELDIPASFEMIDNGMDDDEDELKDYGEEEIGGLSSTMEVEEQFAIVKNESFNTSELPRDHAYTTHDGSIDASFCNDMIQQIILDKTNPTTNSNSLSILSQYTVMLENVFDDGTNSQWSMLLKKMKMSLDLLKVDSDTITIATTEKPLEIPEPQDNNELNKNQKLTTQDISETANNIGNDVIIANQETESEEVTTLKNEMEKISNFCKKLQTSTLTSIEELKSPQNVPEVREKFLLMLKETKKEYRLLLSEFKLLDARQRRENGIKIKENLLGQIENPSEASASDSDSSDDNTGHILKSKRELETVSSPPAPGTPAIVSSTKESDSEMVDDAGVVAEADVADDATEVFPSAINDTNVDVPKNVSDVDESSVDMDWDDEKEIQKLLDLSTLDTVRPQRSSLKKSRKIKKTKKLKKKLEKSGSENSFESSSENETQLSESESDNSNGSDEDVVRLNVKNYLMDFSEDEKDSDDSDKSSSNSASASFSTDSDELSSGEKKKKKNLQKAEKEKRKKKEFNSSDYDTDHDDKSEDKEDKIPTNKTNDIDSSENECEEIVNSVVVEPKPIRVSDVGDRELLSKKLLESSDTSVLSLNSDVSEKSSPNKIAKKGNEELAHTSTKEIDLQKYFEKRDAHATTSAKPTTSRRKSTIEDEDDDYITITDSDEEFNNTDNAEKNKGSGPRKLLTHSQLAAETKRAQKEESERIKRLEEKQKHMTQALTQSLSQSNSDEQMLQSDLVLDIDANNQSITVHPNIVRFLKPHQFEGIKFMYDSCYGSISDKKFQGSGCILAHCMGLGKTLQLIALLHTLVRYKQLKTTKMLVICPKSTVMNWFEEIKKWTGSIQNGPQLQAYTFGENESTEKRVQLLERWHKSSVNRPGVLLLGFEAFKNMVFFDKSTRKNNPMSDEYASKLQKKIQHCLLDPGPDLVVCDEGHIIKNEKSVINKAVMKINTRRRIVLTGTPIQNNLSEYYCMVNFIKPSLLGTTKEFNNLYANPIKDGQHRDSDQQAIKRMKQRSYVLHKKLSKFVQRKEVSVLKEFLPNKYEYCVFVPMSPIQETLYEHFLRENPLERTRDGSKSGKNLLPDYTFLRKIWTHPKVLEDAWKTANNVKASKEIAKLRKRRENPNMDSDDDVPDDVLDTQVGKMGAENDWWREFIKDGDYLESLYPSNKLILMFEILKSCEMRQEKVLIFSAFVAVLNIVEFFMKRITEQNDSPENQANANKLGYARYNAKWQPGLDYVRIDGKTSKFVRQDMINQFNKEKNTRLRVFLISSKAGGQGINLYGANRAIILDTSWNPANDQQNIFRIYRLGQKKPCYIYRLLAMGTMEEKVYSRSVTKQAMSYRVVDKHQIERHYSMTDLAELYQLTKTDLSQRKVPEMPQDEVLRSLLHNFPTKAYKYHIHDSLLENKPDQDLSEAEKNEAWSTYEFENEKGSRMAQQQAYNMANVMNGMHANSFLTDYGMGLPSLRPDLMNPLSYLYQQAHIPPVDALNQMQMNNIFSGYFNNFNMLGNPGAMGGSGIGGSSKNALLRNQLNNPTGTFVTNPILNQVSQQQQQQLSPLNLQRNHQQPLPSPTNMMSGGGIVGTVGPMRMSPNFPYSSNNLIHNNTALPSRATNHLPPSPQSRYSPSLASSRNGSGKASVTQAEKTASSTHKTANKTIQRLAHRGSAAAGAETLASIQLPRLSPFFKPNVLDTLMSNPSARASHLTKSNLDSPATSQSSRVSHISKSSVLDSPATSQSSRVSHHSKSNLDSPATTQSSRVSHFTKSTILDAPATSQSSRVSHLPKSNILDAPSISQSIRESLLSKSNVRDASATNSSRISNISKSNVSPNSSANLSILPDKVNATLTSNQTLRISQLSKSIVRPNSSANLSILPDKANATQQSIQTPRAAQISKSTVRPNSSANLSILPDKAAANTQQSIHTPRSSQLAITNVRSVPPENAIAIQQLSSMNPKFSTVENNSTIKNTKSVLQTVASKQLPTTSNASKPLKANAITPVQLKPQESLALKINPLISIKSPSSINKDANSLVQKPLNKTQMNVPSVVAGNSQSSNVSKSSPIVISNAIGGLNQRQIVQKKPPNRTQAAPGPSVPNVKQSSSVVLPPKPTNPEKPGVQLKRIIKSSMVPQQKDNVQRVQHQPSPLVTPSKKTINPAAMKVISLSATQIQNLKLNMERTNLVNRVKDPTKITPNKMLQAAITQAQAAGSRGFQRPPLILSNSRNNQIKMATAASAVTISKIPNQSPSRTLATVQNSARNSPAGPATVTRIIAPKKRVNEITPTTPTAGPSKRQRTSPSSQGQQRPMKNLPIVTGDIVELE